MVETLKFYYFSSDDELAPDILKGTQCQDGFKFSFMKAESSNFLNGNMLKESDFEKIINTLISKEADGWLLPLANLPVNKPDEIIIAALSERVIPNAWLIVQTRHINPGRDLRISDGVEIYVNDSSDALMLHYLNSKCRTQVKNILDDSLLRLFENGEAEAILTNKEINMVMHGIQANTESVKLSPSEFLPKPGAGVLAYVCLKDDFRLRKLLANLHHKPTGICTNIERKLIILSGSALNTQIRAYSYSDTKFNYHCAAAVLDMETKKIKMAKISQSTHIHLAENVYSKLKNIP